MLLQNGFNVKIVTNRYPGEPAKEQNGALTIYRLPVFSRETSLKYLTVENPGFLFSNFLANLIKWADIVYIPRCWYLAIPIIKAHKKPVIVHLHSYNLTCLTGSMYNPSDKRLCSSKSCTLKCIKAYEEATNADLKRVLLSAGLNFTLGRLFAWLIKDSDALLCVSDAERQITINRMPSVAHKLKVVHNPLPPLELLPLEGRDMGYFGGPSFLKGYDTLLKALLHSSSVRVHATKFPAEKVLKIGKSEINHYGRLSEQTFERTFSKINTVIIPSVWPETWGYVVTEGILRGRLIIASLSGGITEQVDGLSGAFLFKPSDSEALSDLISYVESLDKAAVTELGIKNRQDYLKKFSNDRIFKDFLGVLENVCS
jgi:glycosyltransferase involved in cell wall biosynthesis